MKKVKITLAKSLIAAKPQHVRTAKALGLSRIGDFNIVPDDAATQGKIRAICHLVKVEAVDAE